VSTWAIGDVQGCFDSLQALLATLGWRPGGDTLWLVGDLVNRGPKSLEVLRWAKEHDVCCVLGNHDLHLLARAEGARPPGRNDTLSPILKADDRRALLGWLGSRPLLVAEDRAVLVHAGIPPRWSLDKARRRAEEVEHLLRRDGAGAVMGVLPTARPRAVRALAAFTRMRFVDGKGRPDYLFKGPPSQRPTGQRPWFEAGLPDRLVVFGHWAALGLRVTPGAWGLDTGCVWGGALTAACLETGEVVQQRALEDVAGRPAGLR
jgi:bis(5'-nucleosyl)-tetraphosphatase (symmetrical)